MAEGSPHTWTSSAAIPNKALVHAQPRERSANIWISSMTATWKWELVDAISTVHATCSDGVPSCRENTKIRWKRYQTTSQQWLWIHQMIGGDVGWRGKMGRPLYLANIFLSYCKKKLVTHFPFLPRSSLQRISHRLPSKMNPHMNLLPR